jgi:hypothetical protein
MARTAIIAAIALFIISGIGVGIALSKDTNPVTSLIPAIFGVLIGGCGLVALKESLRKHAMHGAAFFGLVGFAMPGAMVIKALASGNIERPLAVGLQAGMTVVCGIFLALCIRSFIAARKARQQQA